MSAFYSDWCCFLTIHLSFLSASCCAVFLFSMLCKAHAIYGSQWILISRTYLTGIWLSQDQPFLQSWMGFFLAYSDICIKTSFTCPSKVLLVLISRWIKLNFLLNMLSFISTLACSHLLEEKKRVIAINNDFCCCCLR